MRMRAREKAMGVALVALASLALASPSFADEPSGYIPWPSELPGRTVGPGGPPPPVAGCRHPGVKCVVRLTRRLRAEWRAQNAACSHEAIFGLGYLRITDEIRRRLATPMTFKHRRWFIGVVQGFSNMYFATGKRYDAGKPVPESWRIYYDAMDHGDFNAGQDLLLASNAHTNHDLPYAYAASGLLNRNGHSRKHDHDAVNKVNAGVFDELSTYYAEHYDPFFTTTNLASPFDQLSALQMVQSWRENAWRQAERLVEAKTKAQLQAVQRDIEQTSTAWAKLIAGGTEPGHRAVRDAYCATHRVGA